MTQPTESRSHFHAVVWMDHREARVFHFSVDYVARLVIHPDKPSRHLHHKSGSIGAGHDAADKAFLHCVGDAVADAGAILVVGPGSAKNEFAAYVKNTLPHVAKHIVGTETVDHPSDAQIVAHARRYFTAADRMSPQIA